MSNEYITYENGVSSCCSAKVYSDIGICSECKEHCEVVDESDEDKEMRNAVMDRGV